MRPILLAWVLLHGVCVGVQAQSYTIDWNVIAGGGGTSTGGDYTLAGTLGQPEAGALLAGGPYTLQGGFWAGLAVGSSPAAPELFIQLSGLQVRVSWVPNLPGFVLEKTEDLGTSSWTAAPEGNPVLIPATGRAIYYRLRKD